MAKCTTPGAPILSEAGYCCPLARERFERGISISEIAAACGVTKEVYYAHELADLPKAFGDSVTIKARQYIKNCPSKTVNLKNQQGALRLVNSVVLEAVKEWKVWHKSSKNSKGRPLAYAEAKKKEIEDFLINESWLDWLGLNPKSVVEALNNEAWEGNNETV